MAWYSGRLMEWWCLCCGHKYASMMSIFSCVCSLTLQERNSIAVFAAASSDTCVQLSFLSNSADVPLLSSSCTYDETMSPSANLFRTIPTNPSQVVSATYVHVHCVRLCWLYLVRAIWVLFRALSDCTLQASALTEIARLYGVRRIAILSTSDRYGTSGGSLIQQHVMLLLLILSLSLHPSIHRPTYHNEALHLLLSPHS